jgi:hypothetical protein
VHLLIPFGRPRQKLAVAIAPGDVGKHDRRQRAWMMQPFAAAIDTAVVGKLAQHALERGTVGVFGAECARNFPDADFAAALADEGDKFLA